MEREGQGQPAPVSRRRLVGSSNNEASLSIPLMRFTKPVIAAVNGPAVGAGLSLALGADVRIASEAARFGCGFVARGMNPGDGHTFLLPHIMGMSNALEFMFSGGLIDAAAALRTGLVSRVVPPQELLKIANELALKFAAQPPIAIELTKKIVNRYAIDDAARVMDLERAGWQIAWQTEDHKESVRAFMEKRAPHFQGR